MINLDWYECYGKKWGREVTPESMTHPAKFSRKLIQRIYSFLLEEGLLQPGDTVLDPFGGVALGAADALTQGINWIGIELERKFVDIGNGVDCQGISREDWIRFYGRWDKAKRAGRRWCLACMAQVEKVVDPPPPSPQMDLFRLEEPSASLVRGSGKIPFTLPHRFVGNLDLFSQSARAGARAVLLQGDSRALIDVLNRAIVEGIITSPPWGDVEGAKAGRKFADPEQSARLQQGSHSKGTTTEAILHNMEKANSQNYNYRVADGNLGNMSAKNGDFAKAIVSSPPYGANEKHDYTSADRDQKPQGSGSFRGFYGHTPGQLTKLPSGIITSPPFVKSLASDRPEKRGGLFRDDKRKNDRTLTATYGTSAGQVGAMAAGDLAVITSPPYEESNQDYQKGWKTIDRSKSVHERPSVNQLSSYGFSEGQIAQTSGDTFWSAARLIVEQGRRFLPTGAPAVFITKNFVKDGKRVPFTDQWIQLCELCGFELIVHAKAWLVEEQMGQPDLNGQTTTRTVKHKSFFRTLAEKRGSPTIDWEDILIFRAVERCR